MHYVTQFSSDVTLIHVNFFNLRNFLTRKCTSKLGMFQKKIVNRRKTYYAYVHNYLRFKRLKRLKLKKEHLKEGQHRLENKKHVKVLYSRCYLTNTTSRPEYCQITFSMIWDQIKIIWSKICQLPNSKILKNLITLLITDLQTECFSNSNTIFQELFKILTPMLKNYWLPRLN